MSNLEQRDLKRLELLGNFLENISAHPIGNILIEATQLFEEIEEPLSRHVAEEAMCGIRSIASRVDSTSVLFSNPPVLNRHLSDIEFLQLIRIEWEIDELCYACEMVQTSAQVTWGSSTPTRFFLNAIYHYTSSLFLVDKSKPSHKDFPMGGTVICALNPLGLENLLIPIKEVLDEMFGDTTYGEAILNIRHSDLVHGDFSPERIEYLVRKTQMRSPLQQDRFAELTWKFFHRLMIFHLRLLALIASTSLDPGSVAQRYMLTLKP